MLEKSGRLSAQPSWYICHSHSRLVDTSGYGCMLAVSSAGSLRHEWLHPPKRVARERADNQRLHPLFDASIQRTGWGGELQTMEQGTSLLRQADGYTAGQNASLKGFSRIPNMTL